MSPRALAVGAAGAAAFVLVALEADTAGALTLGRLGVCGAALGIAAATDVAERRVPNRVVLPAAVVCAALTLAGGAGAGLLSGLAIAALFLGLSLARPAALGMGDVKLAVLVVLGLDGQAPRALVFGVALAACAGVLLLLSRGGAAWRLSLPLAPFLATGALVALLP
ncbi:MAG TPA: prepilin peptidase [Gaiellaceae bacterium]|nr:prepilin peptidase [Gaiellaceae bacterium]